MEILTGKKQDKDWTELLFDLLGNVKKITSRFAPLL
jgi:hypothetical protein